MLLATSMVVHTPYSVADQEPFEVNGARSGPQVNNSGVIGYWMQETFNFSRNHYDRIVHFSFGLLMAYPIREVFLRVAHTRGFWTYYLPLDVTLAFSGLYEIIEALAALIFGGELGAAYLGTQGDIWDAQKDMALATAGAIICMIITAMIRQKFKNKQKYS